MWAYDEVNKKNELKKVLNTMQSETDVLVSLLINNEVIEATPTHPFYLEGEWIDAGALEVGDKLTLFDGKKVKVKTVDYVIDSDEVEKPTIINVAKENPSTFNAIFEGKNKIKVFNFEVEGFANYYVGKIKVLVHNAGICLKEAAEKAAKELKIFIEKEKKVIRDLLNKPVKKGNAPTFKSDGTKVEIHHKGQKPDGPFEEMHWEKHRGKGNDKINHPDKGKPSKIDRKEFDKAKRKYWAEEFENW